MTNRAANALVLLLATILVPLGPSEAAASVDAVFLHGSGSVANPPTLTLDKSAPTASAAKYKDSPAVHYPGGNPWQAGPPITHGTLTDLGSLHVWLGLKNSDDQGTRFDLRADVLRNGVMIATGLTRCVANVVRNPVSAREVTVGFGAFAPTAFDGSTDTLALNISTRIGTNPDDSKCAGHSSATGVRLYFDGTDRKARFTVDITPAVTVGTKAYVTNTSPQSNSVSVIDTTTGQVITTIPVGNEPRGISYHPGTHRAYAVNTYGSHTVSVIDTTTDTVIDTIALGSTLAFHSSISPDGTRLYLNGGAPDNPELGANVTVIDTATNTIRATIWGFVSASGNMTVSPDGTRLYFADQNCCFNPAPNGYVRVVDTTTYEIVTNIEVAQHPTGVAVTSDGSKLYVANPSGDKARPAATCQPQPTQQAQRRPLPRQTLWSRR